MKPILLAAALALALATPAFAQTATPATPAPAAEKGQKADKAKADKAKSSERANTGGAARGEDRAGAVKDMNKAKKAN